ncbi:hypothetical protein LSH36_276g01023 [Paralvinella palmiformis]|uniref:SOCS box domain-containing protein n=1 Tax=Paralvinella palmiformis TaxID=53620 RepID=A0AAD9JKG8_9ANNE|nr:hypothetical protein LSH36_276g01023 [Paralvinella palmiformis]
MDDLFGMLYSDLPPSRKLLTAVMSNMVDCLASLISEGIDVNAHLNKSSGNTALHISCEMGHHGCVKQLLSGGANPDQGNDFGYCPIHLALAKGHAECVRILIHYGGCSSDPVLVWHSRTFSDEPVWLGYTQDLAKLLFKATSDFRTMPNKIKCHFYTQYLRNNTDKEMVKLYFLTGNRLSKVEFNQLVGAADGEMKAWLLTMQRPQSLQFYARNEIRKYLKPNVYKCINDLPLPQKIKQYLLLEDEM